MGWVFGWLGAWMLFLVGFDVLVLLSVLVVYVNVLFSGLRCLSLGFAVCPGA